MSEGWEDWPLLGPGWKRRTAIRKSGNSCGQWDTYYQSPTGERFRSKPELGKYLGASVNLTCFNFRHGTLITPEQPGQKKTHKKKKKKLSPSSPVTPTSPGKFEKHLYTADQHHQNGTDANSEVKSCTGCKKLFTGVEFGKSRQMVWYCAECRASRRAYNREQKLLKSVGCGKCAACRLTANCGSCSVCLLRNHNPEFGSSWKCVKRRCQKMLHKGVHKVPSQLKSPCVSSNCVGCQGCTATEDCGACSVCIKRQQNPKLKFMNKCVNRRCHQRMKPGPNPSVTKGFAAKKLKTKWRLMAERDASSIPAKLKKKTYKVKAKTEKKRPKKVGRRKNRKCGTCEACLKKLDCGKCDFCQDKPKFGGRNLKRQKCRWRQCLRFAAEKNIPVNLKSSTHPIILERLKREKLSADDERMKTLLKGTEANILSRVPVVRLQRVDFRNGGFNATNVAEKPSEQKKISVSNMEPPTQRSSTEQSLDDGGWVISNLGAIPIKRENNINGEIQEVPLDFQCAVKTEEFLVLSDDVEAGDESTPRITQIFSFGSLSAKNNLDQVLQEFLLELNEIPLPAHWEVLSNTGPTLQLVQRSKASTMAETVVHIERGLHFNIVVRDYTVPSFHELYETHPSRLTTVDEVVELICDLEAYRPCAGLPRQGPRSANCQVLVYEGLCTQCSLTPWPSDFAH